MADASRQNIHVPEWEHVNAGKPTRDPEKLQGHAIRFDALSSSLTTTKAKVRPRFDSVFPPDKTYFGLKRRWFLIAIICAFLALLALIIGLAVGLTSKSRTQNLPLPSNRQTFRGDFTYYEPGLGACGITSTSSQDIVAISQTVFDAVSTSSDPNSNRLCGKRLRASRFNEQAGAQRSVDLTVVDRCTGCKPEDIDVSLGAFKKLANEVDGRVEVTWAWID